MAKRVRGEWAESLPFTHKTFRPYALAIGELTLAWNDLHETLAMLFCTVMGGGWVGHYLAIWHAIKVDRAQRDILMAVLKSKRTPGLSLGRPEVYEHAKWICDRANEIEDSYRNNAIHAPLWGTKNSIVPLTGLGHKRAANLADKNFLSEFRWYRDAISVLRNFAMEIDSALQDYKKPWPEKPDWPTWPHPSTTKPPRRARKAKPPPQPESSQT